MKTVCMIGLQVLNRLEKLHKLNFLYRDVKPENICIGTGNKFTEITLIDFGLAKQFIDSNGNHIPETIKKGVVGYIP